MQIQSKLRSGSLLASPTCSLMSTPPYVPRKTKIEPDCWLDTAISQWYFRARWKPNTDCI